MRARGAAGTHTALAMRLIESLRRSAPRPAVGELRPAESQSSTPPPPPPIVGGVPAGTGGFGAARGVVERSATGERGEAGRTPTEEGGGWPGGGSDSETMA